jgi:hypothetical protein
MIGKIYTSITPFYDTASRTQSLKSRPVLIIGMPDSGDYNVLPISKITKRQYLDQVYDIPVTPSQYPLLGLNDPSYIRTHKQTCVSRASMGDFVGDLKGSYEDLYLEILGKLEQYSRSMIDIAI